MNRKKAGLIGVLVSMGMLLLTPGTASAVICQQDTDDRYMDLSSGDTGASLSCEYSSDDASDPEGQFHKNDLGFTELEKIDATDGVETSETKTGSFFEIVGLNATSGTFSILDSDFYSTYSNAHLVFKYGQNLDPFWFTYRISNVFDADWFVEPEQGSGLSHVTLYGDQATKVPAPGGLALLGIGLLALFAAARAKRRQF